MLNESFLSSFNVLTRGHAPLTLANSTRLCQSQPHTEGAWKELTPSNRHTQLAQRSLRMGAQALGTALKLWVEGIGLSLKKWKHSCLTWYDRYVCHRYFIYGLLWEICKTQQSRQSPLILFCMMTVKKDQMTLCSPVNWSIVLCISAEKEVVTGFISKMYDNVESRPIIPAVTELYFLKKN